MRTILQVRPASQVKELLSDAGKALVKKWRPTQVWVVLCGDSIVDYGLSKYSATSLAADKATRIAHVSLAQVRIFGKNGQIQSERTYGEDPKRSKG